VRPDRLALVLREVDLRGALSGEDVEVIEPEIRHHLFELLLAVRRPQDLLLRQFLDHGAGTPPGVHLLGRPLGLVRVAFRRGILLRGAARLHGGDEVLLGDLT